ncbi:MAG: type II toxin-antitoxin system VapC family toxin [Chloroflexi bacterium]|nr:type II toxin-antitoxin system VapC family toxin [Chloroflexota bacterium]
MAIVDAGPLMAALDQRDRHHKWSVRLFEELDAPLLVCEPVLAEAIYLLRRFPRAQSQLLRLVEVGALRISFSLSDEIHAVGELINKYADVPMSLADACVVRMAELYDNHSVCTLDSDFQVYRKHGRQSIPLLQPPR